MRTLGPVQINGKKQRKDENSYDPKESHCVDARRLRVGLERFGPPDLIVLYRWHRAGSTAGVEIDIGIIQR